MEGQPRIKTKAKIFEFILNNAQIEVNPREWFADKINHCYIIDEIREKWITNVNDTVMKECINANNSAFKCLAYTGEVDFGHTSPDWHAIMEIGIPGLLERSKKRTCRKSFNRRASRFLRSLCNSLRCRFDLY
jgi:hypothetical protein